MYFVFEVAPRLMQISQ